jgi:hypothetical protein
MHVLCSLAHVYTPAVGLLVSSARFDIICTVWLLLPVCNLLQGLGHCEWVHPVSHP